MDCVQSLFYESDFPKFKIDCFTLTTSMHYIYAERYISLQKTFDIGKLKEMEP